MLMKTATVKAVDSQRCVYRIHLFQFNGTSSKDEPQADRAHKYYVIAFAESILLAERHEERRVADIILRSPRFTSSEPA
jgi:hypothetical protein